MDELILGEDLSAALEARATVVGMFRLHGAMLPADPVLLAALSSVPGLGPAEMAAAMTGLIQDGACRVVVIGNEPHLVALSRSETSPASRPMMEQRGAPSPTIGPAAAPAAPPPPETSPVEAAAPVDPVAERNALEVALDVEHERLVLYRVALVLELIAALLFVRGLL